MGCSNSTVKAEAPSQPVPQSKLVTEKIMDPVEKEQFTSQHADAGTEPAAEPVPGEILQSVHSPDNEQPAENSTHVIQDEAAVVKIEGEEDISVINRGSGVGCCGCTTDASSRIGGGVLDVNVQSSGGLCPWIRCC